MLLGLLRFLRGYVRFTVCGRYPERFINISLRRRVRLWGVERRGDGLYACMYMRDYLRVRACARGAGVRLRICERHGLPTCLRRYSDRAGLVIGAAAFVLTIFVMSLFIWSVDVTGLQTVSETEMRAMLRENGVYVGAFKPFSDPESVSRAVMLSDGRVGWMAVNITGSCACVEVKEETPTPGIIDVDTPCDVRTARDGRILQINARQGDTILTEGSRVTGGQLAVSGIMEDALGGVRQVHAEAEIIAETTYGATLRIPRTVNGAVPTGESKRRLSADLFGLRLPLTVGGVSTQEFLSDEYAQAPAPLGVRLPVELVTRDSFAMERREMQFNDNSAKELLLREAELYETFALSRCTVTKRRYVFTSDPDGYSLAADYTCTEDIALTVPIDS